MGEQTGDGPARASPSSEERFEPVQGLGEILPAGREGHPHTARRPEGRAGYDGDLGLLQEALGEPDIVVHVRHALDGLLHIREAIEGPLGR